MYHQFNIQQLYVLPTQCISFVWISELTAIISLYQQFSDFVAGVPQSEM